MLILSIKGQKVLINKGTGQNLEREKLATVSTVWSRLGVVFDILVRIVASTGLVTK